MKQVQALYSFKGIDATELSLQVGDIIELVEIATSKGEEENGGDDDEWIFGKIGASSGYFPASYVQEYHSAPSLKNKGKDIKERYGEDVASANLEGKVEEIDETETQKDFSAQDLEAEEKEYGEEEYREEYGAEYEEEDEKEREEKRGGQELEEQQQEEWQQEEDQKKLFEEEGHASNNVQAFNTNSSNSYNTYDSQQDVTITKDPTQSRKEKGMDSSSSSACKHWIAYLDEQSGYTYYYNEITGESTWEIPPGYSPSIDRTPENEGKETASQVSGAQEQEIASELIEKGKDNKYKDRQQTQVEDREDVVERSMDNNYQDTHQENQNERDHNPMESPNIADEDENEAEDKNGEEEDEGQKKKQEKGEVEKAIAKSDTIDGSPTNTNNKSGDLLLDDLIMRKIEELVEARVAEEIEKRFSSKLGESQRSDKKSMIPAVTKITYKNNSEHTQRERQPQDVVPISKSPINSKRKMMIQVQKAQSIIKTMKPKTMKPNNVIVSNQKDETPQDDEEEEEEEQESSESRLTKSEKRIILQTPKNSKFSKSKTRKSILISPLSHHSSPTNSPKSLHNNRREKEKELPGGIPHIGPPLSSILAETAKQEHNSILYKECRSAVYPPTGWEEEQHQQLRNPPDYRLKLDFIQGYSGDTSRNYSTNIVWLLSGEIAFPAANMIVIMSIERSTQRFISGHDEEVTALIRHPFQDIVVSGQTGKPAKLSITDTTDLQPQTLITLIPTLDGKTIVRLDFSGDGELLLCLVEEAGEYSVTVWDWRSSKRLCSMNTKSSKIHDVKFCPYAYISKDRVSPIAINKLGEEEYSNTDYPYYTLVSAGAKQLKLWVVLPKSVDTSGPNLHGMERIPGIHAGKGEKKRGHKDSKLRKDSYGLSSTHGEDPFRDQWKLEGQLCSLKRSEESIGDSVCIAYIKLPSKTNGNITTRKTISSTKDIENVFMVAGTDKGNIVIWQVVDNTKPLSTEQERKLKMKIKRSGGLIPTNNTPIKLRAIQSIEAHEGVVTDILYAGGNMIATCGKDGLVSFWELRDGNRKSQDLVQLVRSVQLLGSIPGLGAPRSIAYSAIKDAWIVGSTGCAICVLRSPLPQVNSVETGSIDQNATLSVPSPATSPNNNKIKRGGNPLVKNLQVVPLIRGHNAMIRTIAHHPFLPVYATSGTDRTLRVWDATSHELLYITRVWDRVTSLDFHPNGNTIAVGTEEGEIIVLEAHVDGKNLKRKAGKLTVSEMKDWKIKGRKSLPKALEAPGGSNKIALAPLKAGDRKEITAESIDKRELHLKEAGGAGEASKNVKGSSKSAHHQRGREKSTRERIKASKQKNNSNNNNHSNKEEEIGLVEDIPPGHHTHHHSTYKGLKNLLEIQILKYSPDGTILAVASRDKMVHLYETSSYRRHGTCRGHSTAVIRMDFSEDSRVLITNDSAREVLFWDVDGAKQMRSPSTTRDMQWATWTCLYGWPVQGIWAHDPDREAERGLPSLCRSMIRDNMDNNLQMQNINSKGSSIIGVVDEDNNDENGSILVVADTRRLRLFRYPCLKGAICKSTIAHGSHITQVGFLHNDSHLVSAGGSDNCLFQWKLEND